MLTSRFPLLPLLPLSRLSRSTSASTHCFDDYSLSPSEHQHRSRPVKRASSHRRVRLGASPSLGPKDPVRQTEVKEDRKGKNIVLFFDGTTNTFSSDKTTNVYQLANLLSIDPDKQAVFYRSRTTRFCAVLAANQSFVWVNLTTWLRVLFCLSAEPRQALTVLAVYPLLWVALHFLVIPYWLLSLPARLISTFRLDDFLERVGIQWLFEGVRSCFPEGNLVNWPDASFFNSGKVMLDEARPWLTGEKGTTILSPSSDASKAIRTFPLPVARALLLMSSLVYERLSDEVFKASEAGFHEAGVERVKDHKEKSESVIKEKAAEWGLSFEAVSELSTAGGPFAALFYSMDKKKGDPFIVLVFKGTTPENFSEILVDASVTRTKATAVCGLKAGEVHKGFYDGLSTTTTGKTSYDNIVAALKGVAERMQQELETNKAIPLWVAGHSLGSALASLTYFRFLHSPHRDLGSRLDLKDCFLYGCPRLADGKTASAFDSLSSSPYQPRSLWRVANHKDIVTTVPPGSEDGTLAPGSPLDYAFLGPAIRLKPDDSLHSAPFYDLEATESFLASSKVTVVDGAGSQVRGQVTEGNFQKVVRGVVRSLPDLVYNHFPASYLEHLNNIRPSDMPLQPPGGDAKSSGGMTAQQVLEEQKGDILKSVDKAARAKKGK
ncbi:hypothetical protein JCM8547_006714 [Rhodosporidiobolus lusitaniae]